MQIKPWSTVHTHTHPRFAHSKWNQAFKLHIWLALALFYIIFSYLPWIKILFCTTVKAADDQWVASFNSNLIKVIAIDLPLLPVKMQQRPNIKFWSHWLDSWTLNISGMHATAKTTSAKHSNRPICSLLLCSFTRQFHSAILRYLELLLMLPDRSTSFHKRVYRTKPFCKTDFIGWSFWFFDCRQLIRTFRCRKCAILCCANWVRKRSS